MTSRLPRTFWVKTAALCTVTFALATVAFRAQADEWDKKTVLTIDQPVQVTDTYLDPGTYVLKLLNSSSDRHIVQIFNADQSHIINTVMAIPNERLQPTGNSRFLFWETPPGTAHALRAWFYPGDNFGQEFRYPKQLRQIAAVTAPAPLAPAPAAPTPVAAAAPPPAPTPAPTPAAPTQALNQEPQHKEPVEIAQNNPPPAPPPAPQELPKTATSFPLIGLSGVVSLLLLALVKVTRSA